MNLKHQVFVPYCEELPKEVAGLGELVPYQLDYECLRLKDGTYEFLPVGHNVQSGGQTLEVEKAA